MSNFNKDLRYIFDIPQITRHMISGGTRINKPIIFYTPIYIIIIVKQKKTFCLILSRILLVENNSSLVINFLL